MGSKAENRKISVRELHMSDFERSVAIKMRIGMNQGTAGSAHAKQAMPTEDSLTRSLKKQIARLQENLQKLSENSDLSMEEKMKRRQELMRQIADLNNQLRMHELELQREKQNRNAEKQEEQASVKKAENSPETALGNGKKQGTGLSQASMQAMISAENTFDQAKVHGSVVRQIEARKKVLAAEISQDSKGNTEAKQQELSELEQAGRTAEEKRAELLGKAGRVQKEAKDKEEGRVDEDEEARKKEDEKKQLISVDVRI